MSGVLMVSHDVVGPLMAGPGIRAWELARVLAQHLDVTLAVPGEEMRQTCSDVRLWPYHADRWDTLAPALEQAQSVVLYPDVLAWFPALAQAGLPLVIDGSDPHTAETLAMFAGSAQQERLHLEREWVLSLECRAGDFFICASERQRDWWLGLLEASGRINVRTFGEDATLRRFLAVVPYGLPSAPLHHTRQALKGVWPGIEAGDKVILWGGGLWQWLDPLTAVRAVAAIRRERPDVRLVFPGTRHPNPGVPTMPVERATRELARELGLLDRAVFFGDWVPYADWPNYLLEADVGLSLHHDTLEARLAFRTRVLSYIKAGLPVVLTQGEATCDLVQAHDLGIVVGYQDVDRVAQAIVALLDEPRSARAERFAAAQAELTWERAAQPLLEFCRAPLRAADRRAGLPKIAGDAEELPFGHAQVPAEDLHRRLAVQQAEAARLQELVSGYEGGRFIRMMKWLHQRRRGNAS